MTRYTLSTNLLTYCYDPDNDQFEIDQIALLIGSLAPRDWTANPHFDITVNTVGTLEVYKDGVMVYDDHDDDDARPVGGVTFPTINIAIKTIDSKGAVSVPQVIPLKISGVADPGGGGGGVIPTPGVITGVGRQIIDYGTGNGTTAYVSTTGNDATAVIGNASLPFATWRAAALANKGKKVKIRAGVYPPTVLDGCGGTAGNPTIFEPYGTEEVRIEGNAVATGVTTCDSSRDTLLTSGKRANIKEFTIPLASVTDNDPLAAMICEDGVPMILAGEFGYQHQSPLDLNAYAGWDQADTVHLISGKIEGYTAPDMTDPYPAAQISGAIAFCYADPNVTFTSTIANFNTSTKKITLTNTNKTQSTNTTHNKKFSLRNIPAAIKPGQWCYQISGSNITFFVWLKNPSAEITYARHGNLLSADNTNYLTFDGIIFNHGGSASGSESDGSALINFGGGARKTDIKIQNCQLSNFTHPRGRGVGGVFVNDVDNFTFLNNTMFNIVDGFGIWTKPTGGTLSYAKMNTGLLVAFNYYESIGNTALRVYSQRGACVAFNMYAADIGSSAHANKLNFYNECHNCLVLGNNFVGASGFLTWQRASAIHVIANFMLGNFLDGVGIASTQIIFEQNGSGGPVNVYPAEGLSGLGYILNNHLAPDPQNLTVSNQMRLGQQNNVNFLLVNNIMGYGDTDNINPTRCTRRNNAVIKGALQGTDFQVLHPAAYENAAIGDLRLKAGSLIRTTPGEDVSSYINILKAHPDFAHVPSTYFALDVNLEAFDYSAPPIGCANDFDAVCYACTFPDPPVENAAPAVGVSCTWTAGYKMPAWYATTYKWFISVDKLVWTEIGGATSAAYTPVSGDAGKFLAREQTVLGKSEFRYIDTAVA